jgi:cation transport regulator ChaB
LVVVATQVPPVILVETAAGGYTHDMPTSKDDLPSTLKRSPKKVQDTYAKTLDSAEETYDSEERAHRAAWASVKHVAEKRGDHWEPKESYGPSDPQSAQSGRQARRRPRESYGGVDAGKTRQELYEQAKEAGVEGRSNMTKHELAEALQRANDRATAKARS